MIDRMRLQNIALHTNFHKIKILFYTFMFQLLVFVVFILSQECHSRQVSHQMVKRIHGPLVDYTVHHKYIHQPIKRLGKYPHHHSHLNHLLQEYPPLPYYPPSPVAVKNPHAPSYHNKHSPPVPLKEYSYHKYSVPKKHYPKYPLKKHSEPYHPQLSELYAPDVYIIEENEIYDPVFEPIHSETQYQPYIRKPEGYSPLTPCFDCGTSYKGETLSYKLHSHPTYKEYPDDPPIYKYSYSVDDDYTGANLAVDEARDEYLTQGSYKVFKGCRCFNLSNMG